MIPAHWVDSDAIEPRSVADFTFTALSFPTPTDGWIVGDRFLLHVTDRGLSLFFVNPARVWLSSVDFRTADDGWAGGRSLDVRRERSHPAWASGPSRGVIWRFQRGGWESVDLGPVGWPDWSVSVVRTSSPGDTWATGFIDLPAAPGHQPAPRRFRPVVLHSDGTAWSADDSHAQDGRRWSFYDVCLDGAGTGWFVGAELSDDGAQALAVRRSVDGWQRSELPDLHTQHARLSHAACTTLGNAIAVGESKSAGGYRDGFPLLLRSTDDIWHRIELPEAFRHADVGALAAVSDSDVWLALNNADRRGDRGPAFLHWVEGAWTEVAPPLLLENRVAGYSFSDMQFVSPTEGWAIANDHNSPGIVRGLIFHYKGGVWRNRNWNWHIWDQRFFGLLGD